MSTSSDQMAFDFVESSVPAAGEDVAARCAHCRGKISVAAWYATDTRLHFCNPDCRRAWVNAQPSFEVQLGRAAKQRGANWVLQARVARERDGFACQICSISEEDLGRQLDVHHKIPYRSFASNVEANRLENLISLCPSCHIKQETELRRELPLFNKT